MEITERITMAVKNGSDIVELMEDFPGLEIYTTGNDDPEYTREYILFTELIQDEITKTGNDIYTIIPAIDYLSGEKCQLLFWGGGELWKIEYEKDYYLIW